MYGIDGGSSADILKVTECAIDKHICCFCKRTHTQAESTLWLYLSLISSEMQVKSDAIVCMHKALVQTALCSSIATTYRHERLRQLSPYRHHKLR